MPELPEVETIRRQLETELLGRSVERATFHHDDIVLDGLSPAAAARRLRGRRVTAVDRRAKFLLLRLSGDDVLQVQLRMTGRFALGTEGPPRSFDHVAARFELDDGRTLFYDDVRRLGGFRLLAATAWEEEAARLGPEPLEDEFTAARLAGILEGRRAPVKNVLLNARRVAGVGNIYAAESLHRARIDPRRAGGELTAEEVRRLHRAVRAVLREALERSGTTVRNFEAVNGRSGRYQDRLRVYGRQGEPCPRCGTPVERVVQAGRSTFFCRGCQG